MHIVDLLRKMLRWHAAAPARNWAVHPRLKLPTPTPDNLGFVAAIAAGATAPAGADLTDPLWREELAWRAARISDALRDLGQATNRPRARRAVKRRKRQSR